MKNSKGFSLLELLIVVAIILIIATIAIPSLLRSRQAANESAAVANLRTINTAEVTYLSSSGGNYGDLHCIGRCRTCWTTRSRLRVRRLAITIPLRQRFELHRDSDSGFYQHRSLRLLQHSGCSRSLLDDTTLAPAGQAGRSVQYGRFAEAEREARGRASLSILRASTYPCGHWKSKDWFSAILWRDNLKKNKGFSLLELADRSRDHPDHRDDRDSESSALPASRPTSRSAVANMRNLNTAQVTYSSAHSSIYGDITDLIAAGLLDDRYCERELSTATSITVALSSGSRNYTALRDRSVHEHLALRLLLALRTSSSGTPR